jgi:hypothetical protein
MIDVIYAAGDDALSNEGILTIESLGFFTTADALQVRITDFTIPDFSVGTYTVRYKTQQFSKPNGSMDSGNTFTFSFRADKYWSIYQDFMKWKQLIANDVTGAIAEDVSGGNSAIRTNFSVQTVDSNGNITGPGWSFTLAYLQNLGGVSFDQTSEGDPLTVSVTLEYVKCLPGSDA